MTLPKYGQPIVRSDPQTIQAVPLTFPDNIKLFFGDDDDASVVYDGADLVINPKEFGSGTLKLEGDFDVGGDIFVRDGNGLVVGHPSKITAINVTEVQVLGTAGEDCKVLIGRWQDSVPAPGIDFVKSRNPTIGLHTIVQDNDAIGVFRFIPDDGVDFDTIAAAFQAQVDDPSPAVGDIGIAFVWRQMPGGGGAIRETMRLAADGTLFIANDGGLVIGHTVQIVTSELQVLGTSGPDAGFTLGKWSVDASSPIFDFVKSRNATIVAAPSGSPVVDNDIVGGIRWFPDDGTDYNTLAANFRAEVDDASPATGDIGMAFVWRQMPGSGGGIRETMRLDAAGTLTIPVGSLSLNSQGSIIDIGAAGNEWTAFELKQSVVNDGSSVKHLVENTSDTASSRAILHARVAGSSSGDAYLLINEVGSHAMRLGLDVSASRFAWNVGAGEPGTNDAFRITDATPPVITYNTTHPVGTFDYVCEECGRHEAQKFTCCGPVAWRDDNVDFRALVLGKPGALDYMEKVGVLQKTFDNDGNPEVFTVLGPDWMFVGSMAYQNRQRIDRYYDELDCRLKAVGG